MCDREERDAVEVDLAEAGLLPESRIGQQMTRLMGGKAYNAACQKRSNTLPCRCIVVRWSGGSLLSQRPHAPRCNRKQTQEYGRTWTVCPLLSQPGTAVALL